MAHRQESRTSFATDAGLPCALVRTIPWSGVTGLSQKKLSGKVRIFLNVTRLDKYIHFYIGCNTSKGKLVGVRQDYRLVQPAAEQG